MRHQSVLIAVYGLSWVFAGPPRAAAQSDVADVPSSDIRIREDEKKRYFLIGPAADAKAPKSGFKLLLILPGGNGGADFNPFVRRIWKKALSKDYVVAQLVAPKWSEAQSKKLVWPTQKQPWPEMKFDTETFIADVVADVRSRHRIDDAHVYALAWSSSGPAVHAAMLQPKTPLHGAFIAMSVFRSNDLPDLKAASGRSFYLYQSRGDKVCKFAFAETAQKSLESAGARVTLAEYEGGHGWRGDVFGDIRRGMDWLESKDGATDPRAAKAKSGDRRAKPAKADRKPAPEDGTGGGGRNLLANGDFENGLDGWTVLNNSGRLTAEASDADHAAGKRSLAIKKTGGMPLDVIRCDIDKLPTGGSVTVSAQVKTKGVRNTFFKFFVYDSAGESLIDAVDVQRLTGTADWKRVEKTFELPANAASAAVMIAVVLEGELWIDDVRVEPK